MAFDPNDENDKKILEDAIAKATEGLKNKNSELLGDIRKFKDKYEDLEKKFSGIDPEAVRAMLERVQSDEDARLIADGKIDEVVNKRVDRMRVDFEERLSAKDKELQNAQNFADRFRSQVLASAVRDAAIKAGVIPEAADDVVFRAKAFGFTTDNEGNVFARNGDDIVLGKDGKTPLMPSEWLESIREGAPHLWPRASGGGAHGGGGSATKKFAELTEAERVALYRKDPDEYARLRDAGKST